MLLISFLYTETTWFVVWQVVRELLALDNEVVVEIDAHDTLWGETGTFCFNLSL